MSKSFQDEIYMPYLPHLPNPVNLLGALDIRLFSQIWQTRQASNVLFRENPNVIQRFFHASLFCHSVHI